jgi:phage terminase large subunit GpA-like protein
VSAVPRPADPAPPPTWLQSPALAFSLLARAWTRWAPPARTSAREWADAHLYLPPDIGTAKPGKYRSDVTPWLHAIQDAIDDPAVREIVVMKSAQIGYTIGCVLVYIAKRIDTDPCPTVIMFPTTDAAREFAQEKFDEVVAVTPRLTDKIDLRTRQKGNRTTFKKFVGGFLKLVGSNSPRSVKSSSAPLLFIEEPDDASSDVKGQGDSITLLKDRAKSFDDFKIVYGGTPTIHDLSKIQAAYRASDQRKPFVPCHRCGAEHVLDWDNVVWDENAPLAHEVFGHAQPDTARYVCPHCQAPWDNYEKNRNSLRGARENRWRATAPYHGVAGFGYISELYMAWPNSTLAALTMRFLKAKKKADEGDDTDLIVFYTGTLGVPYQYGGKDVDLKDLTERALAYPEKTVPAGGLMLVTGIDVQHNRFAITLRAFGRGEESWLVYWGEIFAAESVTDIQDPVWQELEQVVFAGYPHASGRLLAARAVSIDSSDGGTSDQVYTWVRAMKRRHPTVQIMAVKGDSDTLDKEIFSLPRQSADPRSPTKAQRRGLRVYPVGTAKAKDLLFGSQGQSGRVYLTGDGPGRFHVYRDVRADYWPQLTSEVKAPSRRLRGKLTWQLRSGQRNEACDGEVYALHAARSQKTHILTPEQWDEVERRLRQADLFHPDPPPAAPSAAPVAGAPPTAELPAPPALPWVPSDDPFL